MFKIDRCDNGQWMVRRKGSDGLGPTFLTRREAREYVREQTAELEDGEIAELRRKLAVAEEEIVRQTGCKRSELWDLYKVGQPVVNVRVGVEIRKRLAVERERDALLDKLAGLGVE